MLRTYRSYHVTSQTQLLIALVPKHGGRDDVSAPHYHTRIVLLCQRRPFVTGLSPIYFCRLKTQDACALSRFLPQAGYWYGESMRSSLNNQRFLMQTGKSLHFSSYVYYVLTLWTQMVTVLGCLPERCEFDPSRGSHILDGGGDARGPLNRFRCKLKNPGVRNFRSPQLRSYFRHVKLQKLLQNVPRIALDFEIICVVKAFASRRGLRDSEH